MKAGKVWELTEQIEELEAKLRKSALQELSALGQELEAYQAQLAAEAKLERAVEALGGMIDREELRGAIARGWCSEKNSHKIMDPDLADAIFDEVEKHIKEHFGVE